MSELRPTDRKRIVVRINKNLHMSPNKAAAQAVHAALNLFGVHPGEDVPVIVLTGSKAAVEAQQSVISDHGVTEVKPGAITAGASWDFPVHAGDLRLAYDTMQEAYATSVRAYEAYKAAEKNYWDMRDGAKMAPVVPFGHKDN